MADTIDRPALQADYENDFFLWTQAQAERLRQAARDRINAPLDWDNLAEEIESLGKSDRRQVQSLCYRILVHLIKLQMVSDKEPRNHWKQEIRAWRRQLEHVLQDSPSLRARLSTLAEAEWNAAVNEVQNSVESSGDVKSLVYPDLLGIDSIRLLDADFFPDPVADA